jgi:hypothetical protein
MIGRLAQHAAAADDVDLAVLAAQLTTRAAGGRTPAPNTVAARCWVQTALIVMAIALTDLADGRRARLAEVGGRSLATAAVLDPAASADTARRVIAEPALRAGGTGPVRQLINIVADIATQAPDLAVEIGMSVWLLDEDRSRPTSILSSRILPLTSNRQQELDGARYQVGTRFAALAAADIVAAVRLFVRILSERASARYSDVDQPTGRRPWVRHGEDLRFVGGGRVLPKMVDTLVEHLDALAQAGGSAAGTAVTLLVAELTHAEVWNRLLHRAVTAESSALADIQRVVLINPGLFAHGETWIAAGHLAARLSPTLPHDDHQEIEEAILAATEPAASDAHGRNHLRQRRDRLLGALDPQQIRSPAARRHVEELTAAGRSVSPLPPVMLDRGDLLLLPEPEPPDASDASPYAVVLRGVAEALEQAGRPDERGAARQRLRLAWPRLAAVPADDPAAGEAHLARLRAAGHLACLPDVLPGSVLGGEVFAVVRAALPTPTGHTGRARTNSSRNPSWGETPETIALTAARVLVSRPEWRASQGDQLTDWLMPLLDSEDWVYRYLATRAIGYLFPDPNELLSEVGRRLATESDPHVASLLINTVASQMHTRPIVVDQILSRLSTQRQTPALFDVGAASDGETATEFVIPCLTILAVRYATPHADATVRAWLSAPIEHARTVTAIATCLRDLLNPPDLQLRSTQQNAFELLTLTIPPLRSAWATVTTAKNNADVHELAENTVTVAEHLAAQIYFASGAFDRKDGSVKELGDPLIFSELALPLLEDIGNVHYPTVTQHIVEAVEHLSSSQPKRALLLALQAVSADTAYAHEELGLEAILTLIKRYTADHRKIVLGDSDCSTAIRMLLERFVRTGWQKAIDMAEKMDELFR